MSELLLIETIRQKKISGRTREKAIKAIIRMSKDKEFDFNDTPVLIRAFCWRNTPEGLDFWSDIDKAKDKMSELHELFEFILDVTRAQMETNIQLQNLVERARQVSKEIEADRKADPILGGKEDEKL